MLANQILFTTEGVTQPTVTMEQNINMNAPVKCNRIILIDAKPEKVWEVLSNIDSWANWQTDIKNPKLIGFLESNSSFDWQTGGTKIHSTLHTVVENQLLGWTGKVFGIKAVHNWTLMENNGKTQVLVEESMEGLMASLLKKSFNKSLATGMEKWLELLKVECER